MRNNTKNEALERVSDRWPGLKKRAQSERNPEKLIAILEEIDDMLFNLEMSMMDEKNQPDDCRRPDCEGDREISDE